MTKYEQQSTEELQNESAARQQQYEKISTEMIQLQAMYSTGVYDNGIILEELQRKITERNSCTEVLSKLKTLISSRGSK